MPLITGRDRQVASGEVGLTGGGPLKVIIALAAAFLIGWWVSVGAPI
jgi:hypothetical protein